MSTLTLIKKEFEHVKETSVYNHNYYKHKEIGYTILEDCNEDYGAFEFYLCEFEKEIYLGQSQFGLEEDKTSHDTITIDFRKQYT